MVGGGAGAAPATVTTGTGVVTALGVNTGTAGAFVVNGGALGTPSSGTVTNLTGTASININGTVGATTANTGAFTTVTATTSVSSGVASTTQGSLVLANTSANSTTIKSSNSASAAYTITLPVSAGTVGQVLTTDGAGVTSWATPVGVSARNASSQTITASTFTKLTLGTEDWDTNGWFTGGVFTPQRAGYYLLFASTVASSSAMSRFSIWFIFNGATYIQALDIFPLSGGSGAAPAMAMVYFNGSTDNVEVDVYFTGTGTLTAGGSAAAPSWFLAEWKHA
jgi:hypothetical protein